MSGRYILSSTLLLIALASGTIVASQLFPIHGQQPTIDAGLLETTATSMKGLVGRVSESVSAIVGSDSIEGESVEFWPPVSGEKYPDLALEDARGQLVRLSDFQGKTILLELVAIPCDGCQAFSGGNEVGEFMNQGCQKDLDSIHNYARQFGRVDLRSANDLVFVQLLVIGSNMQRPTRTELQNWAQHFRMNDYPNHYVLRGTSAMTGHETATMIPGFHLIDKDFMLRSSSCGHSPEDNLYEVLLPMIRNL